MNDHELIPACPECQGNGCNDCLGTGLTAEDCDFLGLAKTLAAGEYQALPNPRLGIADTIFRDLPSDFELDPSLLDIPPVATRSQRSA